MFAQYKRLLRHVSFEASWIHRSGREFGRPVLTVLVLVLARLLVTPSNLSAEVLAYIPQPAANQVTIFDTDAAKVVTQVPVGSGPLGVATDTAIQRVYVTNSGDGTVSVIDMGAQDVILTIKVGHAPIGVAVTPDGSRVYVANTADNTVSWFPARSSDSGPFANVPVGTITGLAEEPYGVAASSDGKSIYVTQRNGGTIATISTASNSVTSTKLITAPLPSGIAETRIAYTRKNCPNANCPQLTQPLLVTADAGAAQSSAFNAQTDDTFPPIPTGMDPTAVGTFPFIGSAAYIANTGSQSLTAILAKPVQTTGVLNYSTTTIKLPADPNGVAGTPDAQYLWTVNNDGTMSQVNATSNKVVQTVPIGMPGIGLGQFIAPSFGRTDLVPLIKGTTDLSVTVDSTASILTIANAGPNTAKSAQLTITLPSGVNFVDIRAAQGGCAHPAFGTAGQITCNVGELGAGEHTTVQLGVDGAPATLQATVNDLQSNDSNSANNLLSWGVNSPAAPPFVITYSSGPPAATDFQLEQAHGAIGIEPFPSGSYWIGPLMTTATLPQGITLDPTVGEQMGCFVQGTDPNYGTQIVACPPAIRFAKCNGIVAGLCSVAEIGKYKLNLSLPAQVLFPLILPKDKAGKSGLILSNDLTLTVISSATLTHSIQTTIGSVAIVTNAKDLGWLKMPHKCHDPQGVNFAVLLGSCDDSPAIQLAQTILVAAAAAVVTILTGPILDGTIVDALAANEATQFVVITAGDIVPPGLIESTF